MPIASYTITAQNDMYVVIIDNDDPERPSVTNSAAAVISDLNVKFGGLGTRRVFYRDTIRRYDELKHQGGVFTGFVACSAAQQEFLQTQ
ncbi:hypothetical protein JFT64_18545 [Pseudomonas carnis]|jgi:hypothetical protein|uniref:hypothetical protein n=1 Tax=Pseudomonas carnis TaxID=2487355 RepID=UPI0018E8BB09|nr:hypothetical protein [Pseudomonas carnis]MBJ2214044.1 hypothetical protein [Pseudomonas carnis]